MIRLLTKNISKASQIKDVQYPLYNYAKDIPASEQRTHWNLFKAVNSALDIALETDPTSSFIYSELKFLVKMSNLEVSLDARWI